MASVAIATQPRSTPWYKVDIIFEVQCTKGLLLDQICINLLMLACELLPYNVEFSR
jgi:hypothetical protein